MSGPSQPLWTIDELGERVAQALSVDYPGQSNGQVRAVPDRRTIRYYTTLGLIDPPALLRGRTALYARRHLLQLVAIKRLQAAGQSLAQIQEQLLGLSTAQLEQLARLPADAANEPSAPQRPSRPFWSAAPAPLSAPSLHTVPLAEEAALVLTTSRPLSDETIQAIRAAAGPLLELLEEQGLIRPRQERGTR